MRASARRAKLRAVRRYLVLAVALHVGIMLALALLPKPVIEAEAPAVELIDIAEVTETTRPVEPPAAVNEPGAAAPPDSRIATRAPTESARTPGTPSGAMRSSAGEVLTAQPTNPGETKEGWSFSATGGPSAGAIGLDGKNVIIAQGLVPPPAAGEPTPGEAPRGDAAQRMAEGMKVDLHNADVARGLGSSGPVISSLEAATRRSLIPDESKARFVVDTDADGVVTSVSTSGGQGDAAAWAALAQDLQQSMKSKKVKVPNGWRGVRMIVDLDTHMALPSGAHGALQFGAGGIQGDVSDIGASAHRVIRAKVAEELPL